MWGDFSRPDDRPLRVRAEGPRGWMVGVGLLLLVVGLGVMLFGVLSKYIDWNGPNDLRATQRVAFLWVPGAAAAAIGAALFAWGCWRSSHAD